MSTLRVTFLSSLILELVATISVALVAVEIGLRLMGGHLGLRTGADGPGAGARGLPAAETARGQLPRQRRGHRAPHEQVFAVLEMPAARAGVTAPRFPTRR